MIIDPLLTYYGDDFTGSNDVLESLTSGGLANVLFVERPEADRLSQYANLRAFGIAGRSRMMTPDEMDAALPDAFIALREYRPRIVHYKVSSTFDSSPEVGSIGRAIEVGHRVFQNRFVPLVVGTPALQRFCVFGNLFARSGLDSAPFRLDRHPTMRCHPVTPMREADLRVHLSRQTTRPIGLIDVLTLDAGYDSVRESLAQLTREPGSIVLFDTLTAAHLALIGRVICDSQREEEKPMFVAGSSGVGHALTMHWRSTGIVGLPLRPETHVLPAVSKPIDRVVVLSGSCSPVTERQIVWALANGFAEVQVDLTRHAAIGGSDSRLTELVSSSQAELNSGRSVVIHTNGAKRNNVRSATTAARSNSSISAEEVGGTLGRVLRELLAACPVRRVAVAGGDTSGYVARSLGIEALEMIGRLQPGAPLCIARSGDPLINGLEITFKGGQVGHDDFFGSLFRGAFN